MQLLFWAEQKPVNNLGETSIDYSIKSLPSFCETAAPAASGKTLK